VNLWARLQNGEKSLLMLNNQLRVVDPNIANYHSGGSYPNLFCAHPPFQIDGNFGGVAGIVEMLLQSHTGIIELLPALPDVMAEGSFDRFCVRGGAEISAAWKNHQLTTAFLKATTNNTFKIKIPEYAENVSFEKNRALLEVEIVDGVAELTLKKDETVQIYF
jgi:alpha-L-fucosidase 2